MNAVTCQVRGCRQRDEGPSAAAGPVLAGPVLAGTVLVSPVLVGTAGARRAGSVRYRSCGSHTAAPISAGTAHRPSVSRTAPLLPPAAWYTGTAISEPAIAPADSDSRYRPISR